MKQNIFDNQIFFDRYIDHRKNNEGLNDSLEIPAFRKLIGDLNDKDVLDLGCGFGDASFFCATNSAKSVVAIDISKRMISNAIALNPHDKIKYINIAIEDFYFETNKYDLIISSLTFHYLQNFNQIILKIANSLKPNGILLFSQEHPISTAMINDIGWIMQDGEKVCWPVDNYHEEGIRYRNWFVDDVIKYHRTIDTILNAILNANMNLIGYSEPLPKSFENEKLIDEKRRPRILLIKAKK